MISVNVHEAKTQLSRLLAEVEGGDSVIIARNGKPIAELIPYTEMSKPESGLWRGKVIISSDFDDEDSRIIGLFEGGVE